MKINRRKSTFSKETKLSAIKDYNHGLPINDILSKYEIKNRQTLYDWIRNYEWIKEVEEK